LNELAQHYTDYVLRKQLQQKLKGNFKAKMLEMFTAIKIARSFALQTLSCYNDANKQLR